MSHQTLIEKCKNCNAEVIGSFCSNCGRPVHLQRINSTYLISEVGSVINFDKGILFTIKELLLRPGLSIRKFIREDRMRLVKPIVFIIVTSLIYTIIQQLFHFEDGYIDVSFGDDSNVKIIFDWISNNYGYSNLLMAIFIAMWIALFFRKYEYNFYEILILLCFMMGMGMLIFSFFGIADSLTNLKIIDKGAIIAILYISWGIGQFFEKKKKINYLKAFFSYMLGMTTFMFLATFIGILFDIISKNN